ncbi:uncharacterized protein [Magallana gigas]|uniref:uncharacterized protein n=1 Tax=Magallana gigas TaxID=29159 RepID=UPI003340E454
MGRRESKLTKKPVFMHDKMYNIVPDITTTKRMHGVDEIPTIPRQKPLPLTATGKKYEALPNLGEVHAPSRCNNNATLTRPNPCISPDIVSQPDVKKPRIPLACLDLKSIKQKMDKAEKKDKKAKKKKSKPAPKQMTAYQEEKPNVQNENNPPLAHIPRPPDTPLDPSKPRRIVRIKQEMFYQSLGPEKIAEIVNMVTGNQEGLGYVQQSDENDYLSLEQQYGYINPDPFSGYIHPADMLPEVIDQNQNIGYSDNFSGYIHPADTLPGVIDPNQDIHVGCYNGFPGYINPANTLSGVVDSNQEMGYLFPIFINPADTLPEMMDTNQDMGYPCQVLGQISFNPEIGLDSVGGFPQIKRTAPEEKLGFVKHKDTGKDSLVANPLILPKPQRQIFK